MPTRLLLLVVLLGSLTACAGPRAYSRSTRSALSDAVACASDQLESMGYTLVLADTIGGLLQGHREITGLRESARRGASAATEVITAGLAGGKLTRYDELTVSVYMRQYPQGNTIETTAGMLTVTGQAQEQGAPTDAAKRDARALLQACATRS